MHKTRLVDIINPPLYACAFINAPPTVCMSTEVYLHSLGYIELSVQSREVSAIWEVLNAHVSFLR